MRQLGGGREVLGPAAELLVVGEDRAAAAGGDDLVAVEAQRRETGLRADRVTLVGGAERFGGVLDHRDVPVPRDRDDLVHVDGVAERVHRSDGRDPAAGLAVDGATRAALRDRVEAGAQRLRIHAERLERAVDEMRDRAAIGDRIGGRDERQRRRHHLVARLRRRPA